MLSYVRGGSLSGNIAGTFLIGQALIALQVFAGVALYLGGYRAASSLHFLYGVTAILVLPFAWSYLRDRSQRQALMIYSLLALFIAGLAIRGMTTTVSTWVPQGTVTSTTPASIFAARFH
jgi:chromate transport protein ChrA